MKARGMFVFFLYSCLLFLSYLPLAQAGSFTISPVTIYGTTVGFSGSYPEVFRFNEPTNISLAISVTFNNETLSAVNITAIHVRLYPSSVNVNRMVSYPSPSSFDAYCYADWLSTDYWGTLYPPSTPPPHKIERPSAYTITAFWNVDPLTLTPTDTWRHKQEVQAKLFVQITLCFLDINGEAIWRTGTPLEVGYHWFLFTGEGEAPYVIIYPQITKQFWLFRPEILAILVGSIGLVLGVIALISMRRKKASSTQVSFLNL